MEETERESSETCKESAEVNDLTRFCLASCLKTSRINGVVERRGLMVLWNVEKILELYY